MNQAYQKIPVHRRPDKSALETIPKALDPWEGTDEEVLVGIRPKEEDPDDFRITMNFGIENRSLQYLTLLVLREMVDLHPSQYALRGVHAAIEAVAQAMNAGQTWAVEFDIDNCFSSFSGVKVADRLPLPRKVVGAVLLGERINLKGGSSLIDSLGCEEGDDWEPVLFNEILATARQGLIQGSAFL